MSKLRIEALTRLIEMCQEDFYQPRIDSVKDHIKQAMFSGSSLNEPDEIELMELYWDDLAIKKVITPRVSGGDVEANVRYFHFRKDALGELQKMLQDETTDS